MACRFYIIKIFGKSVWPSISTLMTREKYQMNQHKTPLIQLQPGDALLVIDIQNDFLSEGSLPVPEGNQIIPVLNRYISLFQKQRLPIFMTRDWHPPDHHSFISHGGPWPEHCIAESKGSAFPENLLVPSEALIFSTGTEVDKNGYSGFENALFNRQLKTAHVHRLFIGGLATDYCVLYTVLDALKYNYQVLLLKDAIRAVNVHSDDGSKAERKMISQGAIPIVLEMIG